MSHCLSTTTKSESVLSCHAVMSLENELKRFWEIESVPLSESISIEEKACEDIYSSTVKREKSGRYMVDLPFKTEPHLGETRNQALKRFNYLEAKLRRNPNLNAQYASFMQEYIDLKHMEAVSPQELCDENSNRFYLPHHGVSKEDSTTTKLRVVFDASARGSEGYSLNDVLHIGPKLQPDLFKVLLKFRTFPVALSADIEKMYRQILVNPKHTDFQSILWRFHLEEPITTYKLKTVTYGTSCAPYLAIRTLHQLAKDEMHKFPEAAKVILEDFYVDDLLSGCHSISEAKRLITDLNNVMKSGGFNLRKWSSNKSDVLTTLLEEQKSHSCTVNIKEDQSIKGLGIYWNSVKDTLQIQITGHEEVRTKRQLLSVIARIFDPLGLLSPTTIMLKIMMQDLWKDELSWDDSIPDEILSSWKKFNSEISDLKKIKVSRYLETSRVL